MERAKIFWSGRSQAVRLPKEFRFQGEEVRIRRHGKAVILEPIAEDWTWLDSIAGKVDEDFVQTADERLLPHGTAAITDVGMCGCFDSVIGVKKELSIQKFISKRPVKYEPAEGPGGYGCVVIDVDEQSGRARSILRLRKAIA